MHNTLIIASCSGFKRSLFFPQKNIALTISQFTTWPHTHFFFFLLILFTTTADGGRNSFYCPYPSTAVHRFSTIKKIHTNPLPTWYAPVVCSCEISRHFINRRRLAASFSISLHCFTNININTIASLDSPPFYLFIFKRHRWIRTLFSISERIIRKRIEKVYVQNNTRFSIQPLLTRQDFSISDIIPFGKANVILISRYVSSVIEKKQCNLRFFHKYDDVKNIVTKDDLS